MSALNEVFSSLASATFFTERERDDAGISSDGAEVEKNEKSKKKSKKEK